MGKRGPKPRRADGYHITAKGYLRGLVNGRMRLAHVIEWERHNGAIPRGFQVHHRNGDKQDNRVENLELVDATTHKRLHSGCELRDGVWWKPCSVCGEFKAVVIGEWYISAQGWPLYGRCRLCHVARVCADDHKRRLQRRAA